MLPALVVAAGSVAIHVACGDRYGVFRDELYFLACGRHLSWGYVDQPPLIAVIARIVASLFGTTPLRLRLAPILAHAASVVLAGAVARRLGGGRFAVGLAATCVALSPVLLGTGHLLTMNAFEPLLWTALVLLVLRASEGGRPWVWPALGAVVGIGLLNKYSMAFWAIAILVGLLLTTRRAVLASRWILVAAAIAGALVLPNVLWQLRHDLPMLELLRNGQLHKNAPMDAAAFLGELLLEHDPLAAPIWIAGLIALVTGAPANRWLGMAAVVVGAEILALHGKPYYLAPALPVLFAAGACAAERWVRWRAARVALTAFVVAGGAALAPLGVPILSPDALVGWQRSLGVSPRPLERLQQGVLPQVFADQFGWPELVDAIAVAWSRIPSDLRAHAVLVVGNYGEAGAVDLYGPARGLPRAWSGHNQYWLWGPPPEDASAVLVVGGREEAYRATWREVTRVGETPDLRLNMPYERRRPIWLLRGPRVPIAEQWARAREFI